MAEPVSSLPSSPQKAIPIPWPKSADSEEQHPLESPEMEQFFNKGIEAVERSWKKSQSAISRVLSRAVSRINHLKRERPLEVVAAVAAVAFVVGATIRIWRRRYE